MDLGLEGRVALVGGSSTGIGRAVAEALAAEGCDLVICARTESTLLEARTAIAEQSGRRVEAVVADLATEGGCRALVEAAQAAFGRVDVLVTNTGGPPAGPFEAHDATTWRLATALLLESVLHLVRGVLPGMKERGWGRILTITSIAAKQPVDGLILSNTLRAGVTGLARTLANEVAAHGVTVNNLMPGYTRTERLQHLAEHVAAERDISEDEVYEAWAAETPAGRLAEPEEFAAFLTFMASDRAAYLTGQSIAVDGGWIRGLL
jgi:3-oxoacyl-[acyl-carrier protein] reductase